MCIQLSLHSRTKIVRKKSRKNRRSFRHNTESKFQIECLSRFRKRKTYRKISATTDKCQQPSSTLYYFVGEFKFMCSSIDAPLCTPKRSTQQCQ